MSGRIRSRLHSLLIKRTDRTAVQLLRSIAASHLGFWADFGTLALLTEIAGLYYLVSAVFAFVAGLAVTYLLSVLWIFKHRRIKSRIGEFIAFGMTGVIGMGVMVASMWFFTEILRLHYLISKTVSSVLVFAVNFTIRKYILFRPGNAEEDGAADGARPR
ncbi:MAG: GtrA family protein [Spirochaetales bacterium]|nr:GtrA family protein [Spirochaetales bacterium]